MKENIFINKYNYINFSENDACNIFTEFEKAETTELPVIKDSRVFGIIDLFTYLKDNGLNNTKTDFYCAQEDELSSIYENIKVSQKIIPIIDKDSNYIGFIRFCDIESYLKDKDFYKKINHYKTLQEELNTIIETSYDGIYVTDGQGYTLNVNSACERIEGIRKENVIGKHMQELVDLGVYDKSVTLEVLKTKESVTLLQKTKNNKEIIATATPVIKNGEIIRVVTNSRDITELNSLKKELNKINSLANKYQKEVELLRLENIEQSDIISRSYEMKKNVKLAMQIAKFDSTVLIQGESGVGKDVLSKFIHKNSLRENEAFIKIDCASIPENLMESELFGYEKGSFTGAKKEGKIGLIELANNGTLFLDEIGEMPLNLQTKILRILQDREIMKIGGKKSIPINIRIIAATNKNLEKMVEEKKFREDLFYRLNVIPIHISPLRERQDDIYPLIRYCLEKLNQKYGMNKEFNPQIYKHFFNYNWPGNVRELENIIERLIVTSHQDIIGIESIPDYIKKSANSNNDYLNIDKIDSLDEKLNAFEKDILLKVKDKSNSTEEMANTLKIHRSTVRRKMRKHKIEINF